MGILPMRPKGTFIQKGEVTGPRSGLLVVKLRLEPSLLHCRWTQGVGCSGISPLHTSVLCVLSTSSGLHVMGIRDGMGRSGAPALTSAVHSPGESTHTCMHTHTHTHTLVIQTGTVMKVHRARKLDDRGRAHYLHQQ